MRSRFRYLFAAVACAIFAPATAHAQVCVRIDEARDTLSPGDRAAALILVSTEFERGGEPVGSDACTRTYTLSHVRLGNAITVTLAGPGGRREGTALGLDDLRPLYSQMVRSILTGRPMSTMAVVDRTNVTAAQDRPARRLRSESYPYARLGYGAIFADSTHGAPAIGFGYRAEFDSLGLDVSFFNYEIDSGDGYYASRSAFAGSLLKLEALYFTNRVASRTSYFGGGMSWGGTHVSGGSTNGEGQGLHGELTAGYEIARATTARLFVQADAALPFYKLTYRTFSYPPAAPNRYYGPPTITTTQRYAPSIVLSMGVGWQRGRR